MRKIWALGLVALIAAACATPQASSAPATSSAAPPATASPAAPTNGPASLPPETPGPVTSPTSAPEGFYLRAYYGQSLPPLFTFGWLPLATISDGLAIDGNVAVPAIYPGPLLIVPFARTITELGTDSIAAEAERLGLLSGETDFTGGNAPPGSRLGNLVMVIDGVTYELVGNPDVTTPCSGDECNDMPGTPEAYAAFWQELTQLDPWLASELGPLEDYTPERVAVLLYPPQPAEGVVPDQQAWPLDAPFSETGVSYPGEEGANCVTLAGDDLDAVLPALVDGNELTIFHDSADEQRQAKAVVVVPGAPSPCPDEAAAPDLS
jgi:hypothetical protein